MKISTLLINRFYLHKWEVVDKRLEPRLH